MSDYKDTDVKRIKASVKIDFNTLPAPPKLFKAYIMDFGAYKGGPDGKGYGALNWRKSDVHLDTYLSSIERHLTALQSGEVYDKETGLPHFVALACNADLLIDAWFHGVLAYPEHYKESEKELPFTAGDYSEAKKAMDNMKNAKRIMVSIDGELQEEQIID